MLYSSQNTTVSRTYTSYLVETNGPLTMTNNCFENNQIGMSPVGIYGGENLFSGNYESQSTGDICAFVSNFETDEQFDANMPRCTSFELSGEGAVCPIDLPAGPTAIPTSPSSSSPSMVPSVTVSPTAIAGVSSLVPSANTVSMPSPLPVDAPVGQPNLPPAASPEIGDPPVDLILTSPPTLPPVSNPTASNANYLGTFWLMGIALFIWV